MRETDLKAKTCKPCQGGIPALSSTEISKLKLQLKDYWEINPAGHLYAQFKFKNFIFAMNFANKIAQLAEQEAHHPDLTISWGLCTVELWTHKINGLTESDFILAAKIDALC